MHTTHSAVFYDHRTDLFQRDLRNGVFLMLVAAAGLIVLSYYHYLFFHVLAEFFAVMVAIIMFVVAWHTYRFSRNHFLMYLGCGYFWIAWLDVAHTLLYFGMPTALDRGNFTSQFWIATRLLEALLLLSAPLFMDRPIRRHWTVALFGVVAVLCATAILKGWFPTTFVEGVGLTRFKVLSEYVIITVLVAAMLHLHQRRALIDPRIHRVMLVCLTLTMGSELAFTFYVHMYSISNLIGHILKLFSFWLIYFAIIRTTLAEPFAVMARGSSTYNAVPDSTLLVGSDGLIHQVNRAACRESGLAEADLLGRHCHECFHPAGSRETCVVCQAVAQGKTLPPTELPMGSGHGWRQFTLTPVWNDAYGGASVQVSTDITQRKQAETRLLRSNEELRQYAEIAAHQLQEPLRVIAGHTQLLAKRYRGQLDADADEFIKYAVGGAERLQCLLTDLLRYSQIGTDTGHLAEIDCENVLSNVLQDLYSRIQAAKADISYTPLPVIKSGRPELSQVFFHLLVNALDYAGDKPPHIRISAERTDSGEWQFAIRDQGIGIAPRHHERIFGLFVRLQTAREGEGTGIGLALCKKIIEHCGGRIRVESEQGQGATFYFTLPA